jgi:hypothetical protein
MKKTGIEKFTLTLYFIDSSLGNTLRLVRALEQYYIFTLVPTLNTIKVAGGTNTVEMTNELRAIIGSHNSKPLYVYNKNKTLLLYQSKSALAFVR